MFNCTGMLFFPLPLRLYLGLKTLGLIPVQNSICPFSHRLPHTQTCLVLQVSTDSKWEVLCLTQRGLSSLSTLTETSVRRIKIHGHDEVFLGVPRRGLSPALRPVRHVPGLGKQNICFGNLLALNLWSLLSKRPWKPFASQQLQAVVLCLCEVTNSTAILCVGSVFI